MRRQRFTRTTLLTEPIATEGDLDGKKSMFLAMVIGLLYTAITLPEPDSEAVAQYKERLEEKQEELNSFSFQDSLKQMLNKDDKTPTTKDPDRSSVESKEPPKTVAKDMTSWIGEITAYTSQERQTDSTPCIPATHMNICEEHNRKKRKNPDKDFFYCAAPQDEGAGANGKEIPFGTVLEIENIGTCEVVDRLGKQAGPHRLDLYFGEANQTSKATAFGRKKDVRITVVKWGSGETELSDYVALNN